MIIRSIRADEPSFRSVQFDPAFNVILADRTQKSTDKDTRNGLGKSTLVEIMHFCLGARRDREKLGPPLNDWVFHLDLTLAGRGITVTRRVSLPGKILISGDTSGWPLQPREFEGLGSGFAVEDWTKLLGWLVFGLPLEPQGRHVPGFRALASYFIRRGRDAFSSPFEYYRKQRAVEVQVCSAFLLGLDYVYPARLQELKDRRDALDSLQKGASSEIVAQFYGTLGELEATRDRLEEKVQASQAQLRSFKVHPQYAELVKEATDLTHSIHDLENANVSDASLLSFYEGALRKEAAPEVNAIMRLYDQAQVHFPKSVRKRLEDVQVFHAQLLSNRVSFVSREVARIGSAIEARRLKVARASRQRALRLEVLQTHGALEEYSALQARHLEDVAALNDIEQRILRLRELEEGKSTIRIEAETLGQAARADMLERQPELRIARTLFNRYSEALYDVPGKLVLDTSPSGYKFDVEIERSGSAGIDSMKVFCYDLLLAKLWSQRDPGPRILVHDSTIFDGVDERQIGHALQLAEQESRAAGFQYICLLNSDDLPSGGVSAEFDILKHVRLRLTDDSPAGSLLGFRY